MATRKVKESAQYDSNVTVNVTIEYDDPADQRYGDVKEDLRALFGEASLSMNGARVWVTEVLSTGRPGRVG